MYMILDLCNGGCLHDIIDQSEECELDEEDAAHYMKSAIDALEDIFGGKKKKSKGRKSM